MIRNRMSDNGFLSLLTAFSTKLDSKHVGFGFFFFQAMDYYFTGIKAPVHLYTPIKFESSITWLQKKMRKGAQ